MTLNMVDKDGLLSVLYAARQEAIMGKSALSIVDLLIETAIQAPTYKLEIPESEEE